MMSRGQFNGPGGQHTRYLIPPNIGSSLGSQHNVRNKRFLNFLTDNDMLRLNRDGLAQSGMAVADVTAREVRAGRAAARSSRSTSCSTAPATRKRRATTCTDPTCDGVRLNGSTVTGKYNNYTVEVVQQIGSDSFDPGHGVLFAKTKNTASSCGNFNCFVWFIDAHPEDINRVDYIAAGRHAGEGDGGRRAPEERRDVQRRPELGLVLRVRGHGEPPALLHRRQAHRRARASCTTRSRSGRSTAPARRPAASRSPSPQLGSAEGYSTCTFNLTNTGAAAAVPNVHPQDASAFLSSDVYRLSATATGTGLDAPTSRTRWRPRSSASPPASRSTSRRAPARARSR